MRGPGRAEARRRPSAPSRRAEPLRAQSSGAERSISRRRRHCRRPAPRAPAPPTLSSTPLPASPLTMPRTPPAPASLQPGAAPSARSCRAAAAPGTQVSERDPHAPTRGSPAWSLRTPSPAPPPLPARSLRGSQPPAPKRPWLRGGPSLAGPGSILPSWRSSGRRPRGRLHPARGSGSCIPRRRVPLGSLSLGVPSPTCGCSFSPQLSLLPQRGSAGLGEGWAGATLEMGPGSPTSRLPPHPHRISCAQQVREARGKGGGGAPAWGLRASWKGRLERGVGSWDPS